MPRDGPLCKGLGELSVGNTVRIYASTESTSHTNLITSSIRYGAITSRASLCHLHVTRRKAREMRGFNNFLYGDSRFLDPQNTLDTLESQHKNLVGSNSPATDPPPQ